MPATLASGCRPVDDIRTLLYGADWMALRLLEGLNAAFGVCIDFSATNCWAGAVDCFSLGILSSDCPAINGTSLLSDWACCHWCARCRQDVYNRTQSRSSWPARAYALSHQTCARTYTLPARKRLHVAVRDSFTATTSPRPAH